MNFNGEVVKVHKVSVGELPHDVDSSGVGVSFQGINNFRFGKVFSEEG